MTLSTTGGLGSDVVSALFALKSGLPGFDVGFGDAFDGLVHGSNLIINVALRNWRFLADLGISACHFFGNKGLGAFCNINRPMIVGDDTPLFDPDKPIILTFYTGFPKSGIPAKQQAAAIRWEILSRTYADIESLVRTEMTKMFSSHGFDHERDIAGITVNRWGHSYVVSTPGFFFGTDEKPSPRDVITNRFGRISFGHSEHNGLQEGFGAYKHGERAARQILDLI